MTQVPLVHTRADLWRLIYDQDVNGVVLLNGLDSEQPYWPSKQSNKITVGSLSVELIQETRDAYKGMVVRDFAIEPLNGTQRRTIRQWHLTDWSDDLERFDNIETISVLIDLVNRYREDQDNDTSIIIQCLDGTARCTLYVAYNNVLEMIKCSQQIDVCFAIKQIRSVRPQAINSLQQLVALYNWIQAANGLSMAKYYNI